MAARHLKQPKAVSSELITLAGKFTIAGDGSVTANSEKPSSGFLFTPSKPAATTGIYRVTLADVWFELLYANAQVLKSGLTVPHIVNIDAETVSTTKTIDFKFFVEATGTIAAADLASCVVLWHALVRNTDRF
jgi:hypothetical protein